MPGARRFALGCATVASLFVLLLAGAPPAHAAPSSQACLAKKLKEWGNLRKCQSVENAKALQGKPFDLAKCQATFDKRVVKFDEQAAKAAVACRFSVNGDGTVTDLDTGLQWEQKTDNGTVHDKDNGYTWSTAANGPANGTVFSTFLRALNAGTSADGLTVTGCFASRCDWRLPSVVELASILTPGCSGGSPCVDQSAFGPTSSSVHWTGTLVTPFTDSVYILRFSDGALGGCGGLALFCATNESLAARAVRNGL